MQSSIALVTGASSGIGQQTALALQAHGFIVYAAARRPMPELAQLGIHTLKLDLTDEASLQAGVATILDEQGRIDLLVNNAGYGSYGTIEDVPLTEARRQFEVNVFGAMRLVQLVLPGMTDRRRGRIINVSSMGGRFSMALGGWYHATKYALEALSDALRQEVRDFDIDVVVIEPGMIHTPWAKIAADHLRTASGLGKYAVISQNFATALDFADQGFATDPAQIARVILHAARCARPRTRYRKGLGALPGTTLLPRIPDRLTDAAIRFFLHHADDLMNLLASKQNA